MYTVSTSLRFVVFRGPFTNMDYIETQHGCLIPFIIKCGVKLLIHAPLKEPVIWKCFHAMTLSCGSRTCMRHMHPYNKFLSHRFVMQVTIYCMFFVICGFSLTYTAGLIHSISCKMHLWIIRTNLILRTPLIPLKWRNESSRQWPNYFTIAAGCTLLLVMHQNNWNSNRLIVHEGWREQRYF